MVELPAGDGQRRRQPKDFTVIAFGESNDAALQQSLAEPGRVGNGQSPHQPFPAHRQLRLEIDSPLVRAFYEPESFQFGDCREGGGAAERVAEEGAGVQRLAVRFRPAIHDTGAADAGGQGESTGEGFADADDVGNRAAVFAREPFSSAAKAGVNFVADQHQPVPVAECAQAGEEIGRGNVDAAPALDGFHEDGPVVIAPAQGGHLAEGGVIHKPA